MRTGAGAVRQIAGMPSPTLNACQGDYCNTEIHYPASLQDLETSEHPWMVQARELCGRTLDRHTFNEDGEQCSHLPLLSPEEMAACLECSAEGEAGKSKQMQSHHQAGARYGVPQDHEKLRSAAAIGSPGDIQASWVFEARAYPSLCRWLEKTNWMLDPNDPDQVTEASLHFHKDEAAAGGPPKFLANGILHGVRHRLRTVPVCPACFCIYNSIHSAVVMMRVQHRDNWARRTQRLRREREEREKREKIERLLFFERRGDGLSFDLSSMRSSSATALGGTRIMSLNFEELSPISSSKRPRSANC